MKNPNYRYINLCRLLEILNGPLPGMQAIRRLDNQIGTSYFSEIFYDKAWPLYVELFALEDVLSDIAIDYAAEIYDAQRFDEFLSSHSKFNEWEGKGFTPIHDPEIRVATGIDQFENSWLFGVNRTNLRIELLKNDISLDPAYGRLSGDTNINLTYALFARRKSNAEKLYAYCLYQAIRTELEIKLFDLPNLGGFSIALSIEDLLNAHNPAAILNHIQLSLKWSYGKGAELWMSCEAMSVLIQLLSYVEIIYRGGWPSLDDIEKALAFTLGLAKQVSLLDLAAQNPKLEMLCH
jgi:hypothetical protein